MLTHTTQADFIAEGDLRDVVQVRIPPASHVGQIFFLPTVRAVVNDTFTAAGIYRAPVAVGCIPALLCRFTGGGQVQLLLLLVWFRHSLIFLGVNLSL